MHLLITGGHTDIPIDQVRVISNIFRGKTACFLSAYAQDQGHTHTLVGNPEMLTRRHKMHRDPLLSWRPYRTYDELYEVMEKEVKTGVYEVIIHSAAVSDYKVSRVFGDAGGEQYTAGKIKSTHAKLLIELTPTVKIIDKIREWGFTGTLVKFKLEVGVSDPELIEIARKSRVSSGADIIVANCLEWSRSWAYLIDEKQTIKIPRHDLEPTLFQRIEQLRNP